MVFKYVSIIIERSAKLAKLSKCLAVDGYFAKQTLLIRFANKTILFVYLFIPLKLKINKRYFFFYS